MAPMDNWEPVDWWFFVTGAVLAAPLTIAIIGVIFDMRRRREHNRWVKEINEQSERERRERGEE